MGDMARELVSFSVKGPLPVRLANYPNQASGVQILDLMLDPPCQVGQVTFRNYYTASISILVKHVVNEEKKRKNSADSDEEKSPIESPWKLSISRKVLMDAPHCENGCQQTVTISASESIVEWRHLTSMRLVLRQPSALWNTFRLDDLNLLVPTGRPLSSRTPTPAPETILDMLRRQTMAALRVSVDRSSSSEGSGSAYEITSL